MALSLELKASTDPGRVRDKQLFLSTNVWYFQITCGGLRCFINNPAQTGETGLFMFLHSAKLIRRPLHYYAECSIGQCTTAWVLVIPLCYLFIYCVLSTHLEYSLFPPLTTGGVGGECYPFFNREFYVLITPLLTNLYFIIFIIKLKQVSKENSQYIKFHSIVCANHRSLLGIKNIS